MNKEELYFKYKNLIPKVIKDLNCQYRTYDEYREYYDYGEIGLLKAINTYDPQKSSHTPYFYSCIKREILVFFKTRLMLKRKINNIQMESLNKEIGIDTELIDMLPDNTVNVLNIIIENERKEYIHKTLDMLKPTYKKILLDYYGFNGERKTLEKLSKEYGISRQAVNVKKNMALAKFKNQFLKLYER